MSDSNTEQNGGHKLTMGGRTITIPRDVEVEGPAAVAAFVREQCATPDAPASDSEPTAPASTRRTPRK